MLIDEMMPVYDASTAARTAAMTARRLTAALAAVMVVQSSLGLAFEAQYRDVEWIRATLFLFTMVAALGLLLSFTDGE